MSQQRRTTTASNARNGLVMSTIALLVVLILIGAGLTATAGNFADMSETTRLIIGLVITIVPALLWLALFYAQDRLEPEPHHYVLGLLVLGALLGGAIEQPLLRDVFQIQRWTEPGSLTYFLTNTLLNGILTAALVYAAVRFTVMPTAEFDERIDGIIYGTAVALGLGIAANLSYLVENGTISLGVGTLTIIVTSLGYATFGAMVGLFLGMIKPGGAPGWYAGLGVLVAGLVHGLFDFLASFIARALGGGLVFNPWPGLISTAVFAIVVFGVIFVLMQRSTGQTTAVKGA
jgi:RsiW-degrading membrane proteinase PrsW (M82 family)